jgi:F-type H+-transporting ATPase subunit alpha
MKKVAGSLRLDLAAFRAQEAFSQLGTELDPATQRQLDRGLRMVELLKQPQYKPYDVADQIISITVGTRGVLDDLPLPKVAPFEDALLQFFHDRHPDVTQSLKSTGQMSDEMEKKIVDLSRQFKTQFMEKKH